MTTPDHPPPLAVLLEAIPYSPERGQWLPPVKAAEINPVIHEGCEFYCPHCLAENISTPLHLVSGRRSPNPAGTFAQVTGAAYLDRFELIDASRPHGCEHPVRFKALDKMAVRYGAEKIGEDNDHAYQFTLNVPGMQGYDGRSQMGGSNGIIDRQFGPTGPGPYYIHTAERLKKLTQTLMFDGALRARQRLKINNISYPFDEVVYASDRMPEIVKALATRRNDMPDNIALEFHANPRGDFWFPHAYHQGIPTSLGRQIEIHGQKTKTGLTVFFAQHYNAAKEILRKQDGIFVLGAPRLYLPVPADPEVGEGITMAALTVASPEQMSEWTDKRDFKYPRPPTAQMELMLTPL